MSESRVRDARGLLVIGGEVQPAASGDTFPVVAPADGRVIGRAALAGPGDVDRAARAARAAQPGWASLAPSARERVLLRVADRLEAEGEARLGELLIDESGSTVTKAGFELRYTVDLFRAAAGEVRRLYGETFPNDDPGRVSMVFREPLGVVAVISPFNAPLALLAKMLAFPLAAGNTVVIKPSEETPLVAFELMRLLGDADVPPGVVNLVTGYGRDTGAALVAHADVDGIAFTGSTATGTAIAAGAARRCQRVQLELGGKNPILVLDDVDPAAAARIACAGAFAHAGQICMANARVIVEGALYEPVVDALVAVAESLHLGDPRDPRTAYGSLINEAALAKVDDQVRAAVSAGACLRTGGAPHGRQSYRPTVLTDVPRDAAVWREETFGPVVSVARADDLDHAITLANDTDYGLSAAVLTRNSERAFAAARRIRAGSVHLGMHAFQSNALAPIGGVGISGVGRSGGKYSIEHFTEVKWVSLALDSGLGR